MTAAQPYPSTSVFVDLSSLGHSPLLWDGGRLAIAFNDMTYSFRDLRAELERDGVRSRSHTDTDVITGRIRPLGMAAGRNGHVC